MLLVFSFHTTYVICWDKTQGHKSLCGKKSATNLYYIRCVYTTFANSEKKEKAKDLWDVFVSENNYFVQFATH